MITILKKSDQLATLAAAGITGHAADRVLDQWKPARVRSRLQATLAAALTWHNLDAAIEQAEEATLWATSDRVGSPPSRFWNLQDWLDAWTYLALDLAGVGGHGNTGNGGSTLRHPAFRGLGKGRWHADDGGAYRDAAERAKLCIEAVAREHFEADDLRFVAMPGAPWVDDITPGLAVTWTLTDEGAAAGTDPMPAPADLEHLPWIESECCRRLAALSEPTHAEALAAVAPWATLYNRLMAIRTTEEARQLAAQPAPIEGVPF